MSAKFKVGDKVMAITNERLEWGVRKGCVYIVDKVGTESVHLTGQANHYWHKFERFELAEAAPVGKVRMLERGKLLDTEFDSPVAVGDWLRDNGITGEFELIRVESLGKIKASITVEAA